MLETNRRGSHESGLELKRRLSKAKIQVAKT
jgi:hypothetical protein